LPVKTLRLVGLIAVIFVFGWQVSSWLIKRSGLDWISASLNRAGGDAVEAHLEQGVQALEAKDLEKALGWFDKAIRLAPDNAEAYLHRANAHSLKKDYDKALADFDEAVRLDPKNPNAFYGRGICHTYRKDNDKALQDFSQAIRLDGTNGEPYIQRGHVYCDMKNYEQALADFEQAIRLEPDKPDGYTARAVWYEKQKKFEKAIADYSKATQLDPKDPHAYNNLAWMYATCSEKKFRNGDKAVELALYVCKLTEWKEPEYFDTLAAAYAEIGKFDEAVKWQLKALASPESFSDEAEVPKARQRLQLYTSGKAYTEED
jgi:tetratricopeptide (TPR) repeat protein